MATYNYTAMNEVGTKVSGTLEAETSDGARRILSSRGFIPTKVTKTRGEEKAQKESLGDRLSRVGARDIILFTKQFATMLRAGIPIIDLFKVAESQTENPKLKKVIAVISKDIQEGASLHQAMKKHPSVFSPLYLSMMRAGETSGALPQVLERLIYIIDHEEKVKKDIRGAMIYPALVTIVLTGAFFLLEIKVVPVFAKMFSRAKIDLPLPTKICIEIYTFLATYWPFLIGGIVAASIALYFYLRTEQGKYTFNSIILQFPIFGDLFLKAAMSRFASIFAILQSSGVTVLDSFTILSGTIGSAAMSRQFDGIRQRLEQGQGISAPLREAKFFPPMVINMVAIGEESGNLEEMLQVISDHYDDEVEYAVKALSEAIVPILTIALAAVVGFFALAIFLPMWDMTKMVKH
ncbi:Type II secretion system protein, PilC [Desulfatibacillum aliphaticivorans]|uniref:Type II secretion system protein, PilC n=1 Tax=Desulfatibacillum aliphaticivorans TaxID=218208 RepID=B8FD64_DESAL|nr:type II secretion system F family protein [Desulfatibacillum aliphaticivorans]ACL06495.1 Type II secretion system protein, PilC [Desulfatibacillum aliphaticivorans]